MITIDPNIIEQYTEFISGSVTALVPLIGITAGIFLAFAIFDQIVRVILKTAKK